MNPKNTRSARSLSLRNPKLAELSSAEHYDAIHLNDAVKAFHLIGLLIAVPLFVWGLVRLSPALLLLQYLVSTGFSVASHWIFDGFVPRGPIERPLHVLRLGLGSNWRFLTRRHRARERQLLAKHPWIEQIYQ